MRISTTYCLEYDLDRQTAARADCNFLAITEVRERDFELVSARTGIGIDCRSLVIGHILDLYLIVERHRAGSCCGGCRKKTREESNKWSCAGTEIILAPDLSPTRHENIEMGLEEDIVYLTRPRM